MVNTIQFFLAVVLCYAGMSWFALAMNVHWHQVFAELPMHAHQKTLLRSLGLASLLAAAGLCVCLNHPTMAPLVWVMTMTAGAVSVAMTLAWRPRVLALLVPWSRQATG